MLTKRPRPLKRGISLREQNSPRPLLNLRVRCSIEASLNKDYLFMNKEELERKLFITKKARFNAAQRISRTQQWLSSTITFVSILQILISLVLIINEAAGYQNLLTCFTIISSILILTISNSSILNNGVKEAFIMHKCGIDISRIYDELRFSDSPDIEKSYKEYNRILSECGVNHKNIDYKLAYSSMQLPAEGSQLTFSDIPKYLSYWRYSIFNFLYIIFPIIVFIIEIIFAYILLNYLLSISGTELDLKSLISKIVK